MTLIREILKIRLQFIKAFKKYGNIEFKKK